MDKLLAVAVFLLFIAVIIIGFIRSPSRDWDKTYPIVYSYNTPKDKIQSLPQLTGLGAQKNKSCTDYNGKCLYANCVGPKCWPAANAFCQAKGYARAQEFSVVRSPTGEAIDFATNNVLKDWVNCTDDDRCEGEFHNVFDHITCIKK